MGAGGLRKRFSFVAFLLFNPVGRWVCFGLPCVSFMKFALQPLATYTHGAATEQFCRRKVEKKGWGFAQKCVSLNSSRNRWLHTLVRLVTEHYHRWGELLFRGEFRYREMLSAPALFSAACVMVPDWCFRLAYPHSRRCVVLFLVFRFINDVVLDLNLLFLATQLNFI